jgi:prevent-host-death family protein
VEASKNKPVFDSHNHGYNSHERRLAPMRSVNVAELKNRLSKYLTFAKGGEEIIIRDRNLPVAKLVPFSPKDGTEEELLLVAAGKMRLPDRPVDLEKVLRIPTGKHLGRAGTQALLEDREQSL